MGVNTYIQRPNATEIVLLSQLQIEIKISQDHCMYFQE
jgi:hypothetical protein